ncbi:hypothetical protein D3C71_345490 [compost metagenome]
MEEQHARLFDLIESKSFEELSPEEKRFVLKHLSAEEYAFQRRIIASTAELEYETEEPLPLVLKPERKVFFSRNIPLYQAMIGAACLILVFVAVWPGKTQQLKMNFAGNPLNISLPGASSIQIIHDTITKEIPVFQAASGIIRDTITVVQYVLNQQENRMLEAGNTLPLPALNEQLIENRSLSYKDDQVTPFLPNIQLVNTMK